MPTGRSVELEGAARQLAEELRGRPGVEAVVLFGSVARGKAGPDSDLDLAVLGERDACQAAVREMPAWLEEAGAAVEWAVLGKETRYGGADQVGTTPRNIVQGGKPLWGVEAVLRARRMPPRMMTAESAARWHDWALQLASGAVAAWGGYERYGSSVGPIGAALHASEAVQALWCAVAQLRGWDPGQDRHRLGGGAEAAAGRLQELVVVQASAGARPHLRALAAALEEDPDRDFRLGWTEVTERAEGRGSGQVDAEMVGRRVANMLRALAGEHAVVEECARVEGLGQRLGPVRKLLSMRLRKMAEEVEKDTGGWRDEGVHEAAGEWLARHGKGGVENAASRK